MADCKQCGTPFEITNSDLEFYDKISPVFNNKKYQIPPPTQCPECRRQRRRAQRNERHLYKRKGDLTGKDIIAFYPPDSPYTVYDRDTWWSNKWDPLSYGIDFDFNRPFFEQFNEMRKTVPRAALMVTNVENCPFSSYCAYAKNCYMCSSCVEAEDLLYCYQTHESRSCVDCFRITKGEICYECVDCVDVYNCHFCRNCESGTDLLFCEDCRSCNNCIGCKNLVNAEYQILNRPVSKEEYKSTKEQLQDWQEHEKFLETAREFFISLPNRATHTINCDNCMGDHLKGCEDSFYCFDAINLEKCSYLTFIPMGALNCYDSQYSPQGELIYECMSGTDTYGGRFILHCWHCHSIFYSEDCHSSQDLFGCIGLKQKQYCIFNKQYSKQQYEELVPRIIEYMQKTKEWGEFFPMTSSLFAYNESIAQESHPLPKEKIISSGLHWKQPDDRMPNVTKIIPSNRFPNTIEPVQDDVLDWAIRCDKTNRPFRITKQELRFYRDHKIPLPRYHPDERHKNRLTLRNPQNLWNRECSECGKAMETTYSPERPEIVYCEECYLKEVY